MKKVISITGIIITIYMLCLFININFHIGIVIGLIIGLFMAFWVIMPSIMLFKALKGLFILGLSFFAIMSMFIAVNSFTNQADYSEDALIVLGCGINGTVPSRNLKDRLDTAIEYYNNNSDALIVVSGGQGPQEDITEAEAMERYLLENNISKNIIIKEDKSTSTNENFIFSNEILINRLGENYKAAYITNDFHIYRAGRLAELNGVNAVGYSAPTELFSIIPNYLRESLAVIQLWVFDK